MVACKSIEREDLSPPDASPTKELGFEVVDFTTCGRHYRTGFLGPLGPLGSLGPLGRFDRQDAFDGRPLLAGGSVGGADGKVRKRFI